MRPGDHLVIGVVGGQGVELADLLADGFELLFEASDVMDGIVGGDGVVEFDEGAFFGCVDAASGDFVEELLCPCGEGRWPVAEWACVVDDGGEFLVFDDVGPVLQDPVLPGRLMGSGVLEGVDLVGDVDVRICEEVVDDLALIGWGLREEFVEFEQPLACVGDADRCGCLGFGGASLGEPVAGGEGGVHELAPLVGEVGVIGERAVSGGVVGELVLVAPGGERADVVVVDDGCCRVGGAWPGPPGEPVRWGGAELVEQLVVLAERSPKGSLGVRPR